ncbi:MAG: hypothetical protein ACE5IK_08915 [Acidobacteriota bacterium]
MSLRQQRPGLRNAARLLAGTGGIAVALLFGSLVAMAADGPPVPGLHAYTMGHAMHQDPPDRVGGPLTVTVTQSKGSTRWVLPGPRFLDPSVFGTPDHPVGFDPAPFPLLGVPLDKRKDNGDAYTFINAAAPFSDWREVGVGSIKMKVVDVTAMDGARTKDKIDFQATFSSPDGKHSYRVTAKKPIPHGMAYPFFGGVVTNHLLHGATGIGTRQMPTEYTYAGFWAMGNIYRDGQLVNENQMVHVMVTEVVRGDNYKLNFDGKVGNPPRGLTLHLMVPPFAPGPKGLQPRPVKTGFVPFPFIQKHMMKTMEMVKKMPPDQQQKKMATLQEVKQLMEHTKEHVMQAMKAGKMDGQPFFHVMFGNIQMKAKGS